MYGKHFQSMYTGSLVGKGTAYFAVMGYVVAHACKGHVELNPKILAFILGGDEGKIEDVIDDLCSPDPKSRSKEEEGRRLVREGEYLYRVVNHEKYRDTRDEEGRKEYMREYMRDKRSVNSVNSDVNNVNSCKQLLTPVSSCKPIQKQKQSTEAEASTTTKVVVGPVDFVSSLKTDSTYFGIDIDREFGKMSKWCEVNGREPTKRRFVNWLNRIEKPISTKNVKSRFEPPSHAPAYPIVRAGKGDDLTDEQIAKNKEVIAKEMAKLKALYK